MNDNIRIFVKNVLFNPETPDALKEQALDLLIAEAAGAAKASPSEDRPYRIILDPANAHLDVFLTVDGKNDIEAILRGGNPCKIQAVKRLRELTGCGLKEGKYAVENPSNFKNACP